MAPEVAVPANFGKHHLKSRTHNNLELLCAEGEVQRANSMILSLNSSVIEDLIARLEITSLDMQDFAAPAVNCFVESMYCGELENCDKTNFRDLNKMGHVFDVTWFVERCLKYFTELVDKVTGRCYEDILFVTEEAWFVEQNLKNCKYIDIVMEKLNTMKCKKSLFLKQYASDLTRTSINQLQMVVKVAGTDIGILVSILTCHLQAVGASTLTETARHLFRNINFVECFSDKRYFEIANNLFGILGDNCCEDFKCALEWISSFANTGVKTEISLNEYPIIVDLPIKDYLELDWDCLCNFLFSSNKICNLYHFFDAVFMWFHVPRERADVSVPRLRSSQKGYIKDFIELKNDRSWGKISKRYLESITGCKVIGTEVFINSLLDSDYLTSDNGVIFKSKQDYEIKAVLGKKNLLIPLVIPGKEKVLNCGQESSCGVMLECTVKNWSFDPAEKNLSLKFVAVTDDDTDVHYHNVADLHQTVSLLIEINSHTITPVPFNTQPCSYDNGSWTWGFHEITVDKNLSKPPCLYAYRLKKCASIRFMACLAS